MKLRSHICILSILIAAMVAGCSDKPVSSSTEHHSSEHDVMQHSEHENATDDIKTKINSVSDSTQVTRSADAHSHGDAELAVVLEKDVVTIELDSPIHNILGFEHSPETESQKTALKRAELRLGRGETLFEFNDKAKCTTLSNDMAVSLFEADEHEEDEHEEDEHEEEHGHHDEHDETETDKDDSHKDVFLTYEFKCQNPAKLSNLNINLFEFFEELSEVDVTYLGPTTQKQVILNRNQSQLDITP